MSETVRIGLIGCGGIALANHLPAFQYCDAELTALCDPSEAARSKASEVTGVAATFADAETMLDHADIDAVIIATPNVFHAPLARAACAAGKHVLCEKPLAMNVAEAESMLQAAEDAGVRHMTAFTYRFVPGFRYAAKLVADGAIGEPRVLHGRRIYGDEVGTHLRWRQHKSLAGSGVLGDFLSHRIDLAQTLAGAMTSVCCDLRIFEPERGGEPADVEDWVSMLAHFETGASGMLEASRVGTGHAKGSTGPETMELLGTAGGVVYDLNTPHQVLLGKPGEGFELLDVPREFLTVPGTPRDPHEGQPLRVFRYDQVFEFTRAIREGRDCVPSFREGVAVQRVMAAAEQSAAERRWVDL